MISRDQNQFRMFGQFAQSRLDACPFLRHGLWRMDDISDEYDRPRFQIGHRRDQLLLDRVLVNGT